MPKILSATPPRHLHGPEVEAYERAWARQQGQYATASKASGPKVGSLEWHQEQEAHEELAKKIRAIRVAEGYLKEPKTMAQQWVERLQEMREERAREERAAWEATHGSEFGWDIERARGEMLAQQVEDLDREQRRAAWIAAAPERARREREAFWEARIYPQFRSASLDDYPEGQQPALRAMMARQSAGEGLSFVGPTGTGKTHLACALLRALCVEAASFDFILISQDDLLDEIKGTFGGGEARDFAEFPGVLVIDDAFSSRDTEFAQDILHKIIGKRYNMGRCTWITTNVPLEKVPAHYARLSSRLRETNGAPIEMRGRDRRLTENSK